MSKPAGVFLEHLTWNEAETWFDRQAPVIIPIGALSKEHGAHLPLNTDFLLARELARRVADVLAVVIAPVVGFGYYPSFRAYPGSQHLRPETFMSLLKDLIEGFIGQGVKNIAIINTGVSTEAPIRIVVRQVLADHQVRVAVADIRRLGAATDDLFTQKLGGHGDEHETSLILSIKPGAVRQNLATPDYGNALDLPETVFYQPSIFSAEPAATIDYSRTGVRGDPTLATVEKGDAALDAMAADLVDGMRRLFTCD